MPCIQPPHLRPPTRTFVVFVSENAFFYYRIQYSHLNLLIRKGISLCEAMPLGPEEERLQNLYRIIEATHTLRADLEESLDDLNAFDVGLRNDFGNSNGPRRSREEAHRSLREASAALAELRQRVQDSLAELAAVGGTQSGDTTNRDSDSRNSFQQPSPSEGTLNPLSESSLRGQVPTHHSNINLIQSLVPEMFRTTGSLLHGAPQPSDATPREGNLSLALHFVSNSSPAASHSDTNAPQRLLQGPGSEGHDMLRPALARLSAVMGRREPPPPGSDPAATSLGRRVAARAAARNGGTAASPTASQPQSSRLQQAADEGLLGDLHIFIMPMPIPNDPSRPGFSNMGRAALLRGHANTLSQAAGLNPSNAADDLPDLVPLDAGPNAIENRQGDRSSDPTLAPRIPPAPTSALFSRLEGEETGSWPPRRRRGSSFEEAVENAEGRSYQIRRRLNADGDEYVHQIPRREWTSARTNPDTVQSRAARGFFPLTYAALGEASGTSVRRQPGASAESSPFGTSMLDLPSSIESEARPPSLPISIRRRRSGKQMLSDNCLYFNPSFSVFLDSDGDELSADEDHFNPRTRSSSSRTVNGNVYRTGDPYLSLRRRVLQGYSETRLASGHVDPSPDIRYFGTSEPFYVNPLPLPLDYNEGTKFKAFSAKIEHNTMRPTSHLPAMAAR